jgi:hypothetical protein
MLIAQSFCLKYRVLKMSLGCWGQGSLTQILASNLVLRCLTGIFLKHIVDIWWQLHQGVHIYVCIKAHQSNTLPPNVLNVA